MKSPQIQDVKRNPSKKVAMHGGMCPHCHKWANDYKGHVLSSCRKSPVPNEQAGIEPLWGPMLAIMCISLFLSWIGSNVNAPTLLMLVLVCPGFAAFCYLFSYVIQQISKGEGL